jgi:hypothetical protein
MVRNANQSPVEDGKIRVHFINALGSGYAEVLDVNEGTTVEQFLAQKMGGTFDSSRTHIRVNREPAAMNDVLETGDRISATPVKAEGAGQGDAEDRTVRVLAIAEVVSFFIGYAVAA